MHIAVFFHAFHKTAVAQHLLLSIPSTWWPSCMPPSFGRTPSQPHTQPPISGFRLCQIRTGPRVSLLLFKLAAITCGVTQLNHRAKSWSYATTAWKCSFLQPPNTWEPLLPATQQQLIHHQQYKYIIFWALIYIKRIPGLNNLNFYY